ncbi:MAG: Sensory box histidine kinase/response regulator [Polyangiaceae bacterium]|nr:Sensory box histidine kinase/response regulator [Polyangiaceae bacterium]
MLKTVRVPEALAPLFEQAQTYVSGYFADRRFEPERARIEIAGQRYVLVRAGALSVEFHELMQRLYGSVDESHAVAHGLLFDLAHAMGLADGGTFADRLEVSDPIARMSAGPVHFAYAGWAFVDISAESRPSPNDDFYLLYDHPYSFESDSWLAAGKSSSHAVCVMNSGYSSGWCEHAFGLPLVAAEILCRAKGDDTCRFIMAPPSRIEERIRAYVSDHPEHAGRVAGYQVESFLTKRTDAQLLRYNLELRRREQLSRELNARLVEALPGGVVEVGRDGSIRTANVEAMRILGLSYDALTQRVISDFESETIFEDGRPAAVADYPVAKALSTGQPQPAVTLGVRRPGRPEVSWAVYRAVAMRDPATQEVTGAVVTLLDITERKRFEDKLRQTQKLESLGVLAGGIAHDFNNLLVTILGNASFAKSICGDDPRLAPLLDEIELGAQRAAELTRQMLDYSGEGKMKVAPLELSAAVREMAKLLAALIPKQVELHYQFQEGLPPVDVDATQIRQVLMNLITNAAESLGERAGRVVIALEQRFVPESELFGYQHDGCKPGNFVVLSVKDDGQGMSEETRGKVFDPFFTTKFQGRGLGMAAVLGIVRGHHGAIRIESASGSGTEVRLLLPAREAAVAQQASGVRGTVLVVDDDAGVLGVARRVLSAHGYRVLTAANGVEGVACFEQNRSDIRLVLMDMTMPQMNGVDALRRIRQVDAVVPVLLSSGYGASAAAHSSQFSGILVKPYGFADLLAAVQRSLGEAPFER